MLVTKWNLKQWYTNGLDYLTERLGFSFKYITSIMLICVIGFPVFYFLYRETEILWLDTLLTIISGAMLLYWLLPALNKKYLSLAWFISLLIIFPFNFTFNLLLNPDQNAYQLGQMVMLLISIGLVGDIVLLLLFYSIGILLAIAVFFLYKNTFVIPQGIYQSLPLYLLGAVLGIALIGNRDYNYRKERKKTTTIIREKDNLADISRKDSVKEAISAVAHELTQPLSAVINYTNGCKRILQSSLNVELPAKVVEALDQTCKQAHRAGDILHTLKNYFSETAEAKELHNINDIITNLLDIIADTISQYNLQISLSLDPMLPSIYCNKTQIEIVFINLIRNSIDAVVESNKKEKKIMIESKTLSKDEILFSVEDTGIGIDRNNLNKIFFPFVSNKKMGLGIGLALCDKIIQEHYGRILVTSEQNSKTKVDVILPISKN